MPESSIPPEIRAMSFEDALAELKQIVEHLERGEGKLNEAIEAYERGTALKRHCEAKLREAQMKIEKVSLAEDGNITLEPLDVG
jgi:exodeoxyribonuclease VII small subunit